jgi:predicted transport protein
LERITNFACVAVKPQIGVVPVYLKIDPESIKLEEGFDPDVSTVGHYGTGDLELTLGGHADLEKAKGLICQSYELV